MKYYKVEDVIRAIEEMQNCYNGWSDTYDKAQIIGVLEELPTIEVSEDCISREWLIKALDNLDWYDFDMFYKVVENAPSVVPQTERLCDNCEYYGGGEVCDHPSIGEIEMGGKGDTFPWIKETPKWCPLKDEPTTEQSSKVGEWSG